jgi:serine/threonine protein phosphatase 1
MRELIIGDIHGGYRALKQVLEAVNFDYENDKLISLGDVCDGWPDVAECIEELMKIKNLIKIRGNHDEWTLDFLRHTLKNGVNEYGDTWYTQGGKATYLSYYNKPELVDKHIQYLEETELYHIDEQNRLFLHAGFNTDRPIDKQEKTTYFWDRVFWSDLTNGYLEGTDMFKEVYIGHTPTISKFKHGRPVNISNVWNMDTGATYIGKLSIMDLNTKELTQSDPVFQLYPEHMGRNGKLVMDDPEWNKWGLFEG